MTENEAKKLGRIKIQGTTQTWLLQFNPKPMPIRIHDWDYTGDNYDGAPDAGSPQPGGTAETFRECLEEIDCFECDRPIEERILQENR